MDVGIIGLGYFGKNYVRLMPLLKDVRVKYLCDVDERNLDGYRDYGAKLTTDYGELAEDPALDAVFVVTPTPTHFEIASELLATGKHVLVEKPMTASVDQALRLRAIADASKKTLMVGHVYVYHPAVGRIKDLVDGGSFGKLYYGFSVRVGPGPVRSDTHCLWDLAPHELSILDHLSPRYRFPTRVSAEAKVLLPEHEKSSIYDYATAHLEYGDGFQFTIVCSWVCPEKMRWMAFTGQSMMAKFDDADKLNPLLLTLVGSSSRLVSPGLEPFGGGKTPLLLEIEHFLDCVEHNRPPRTGADQGLRVVRILEAMDVAIRAGVPVSPIAEAEALNNSPED